MTVSDLGEHALLARILVRLERLAVGNFGDARYLRGGMGELRIDWGAGYRVYFGRDGATVIVLLCGGDKRAQDEDIKNAKSYFNDFKRRTATPQGRGRA